MPDIRPDIPACLARYCRIFGFFLPDNRISGRIIRHCQISGPTIQIIQPDIRFRQCQIIWPDIRLSCKKKPSKSYIFIHKKCEFIKKIWIRYAFWVSNSCLSRVPLNRHVRSEKVLGKCLVSGLKVDNHNPIYPQKMWICQKNVNMMCISSKQFMMI